MMDVKRKVDTVVPVRIKNISKLIVLCRNKYCRFFIYVPFHDRRKKKKINHLKWLIERKLLVCPYCGRLVDMMWESERNEKG